MYEELVKRLIKCEQFKCNECDYEKILGCRTKLTIEAVNAIEDMNRSIDGLEADNESLCQKIEELRKRIDHAIDLYNRNIEKTAMYEALMGTSPKEET